MKDFSISNQNAFSLMNSSSTWLRIVLIYSSISTTHVFRVIVPLNLYFLFHFDRIYFFCHKQIDAVFFGNSSTRNLTVNLNVTVARHFSEKWRLFVCSFVVVHRVFVRRHRKQQIKPRFYFFHRFFFVLLSCSTTWNALTAKIALLFRLLLNRLFDVCVFVSLFSI